MDVLADLFNDWVGILSLGVVLFVIGMAIFFILWFVNKAKADETTTE